MSSLGEIDNRGIPPLAGVCSYDEAARAGLAVDETVARLKRYNYVLRRLLEIGTAHLPSTPEWEVKCALSLHIWLDTEHASAIRARVAEMREPPLHLDDVPDERLEAAFEELIRARGTAELIAGVYVEVRAALAVALEEHIRLLNPLFDHPTYRLLRTILREQEEMLSWGWKANDSLVRAADPVQVDQFRVHVRNYIAAAGGISGAGEPVAPSALPEPRWDGVSYEMDAQPRRDDRFVDPFNATARIDDYADDESRPADERTWALAYKRLREMDVPEMMAPIIYKTRDKPWAYYHDLARQLWDEARHAMMGEVSLVSSGIPFYEYPILITFSTTLNLECTPLEAHAILLSIEQSLMPRKTGKRHERSIAELNGDDFFTALQDYDWADEVLHVQIGRRWLPKDEARALKEEAESRLAKRPDPYAGRSSGEEWWPEFLRRAREGRLPVA
jgi:hypothetical protein